MYTKRKLDKDVRNYIKSTPGALKGGEIDRIGRKHGFHIKSTLLREDTTSPQDA